MTRVIAVIDTNVVVAAILTNDLTSPTTLILDAMQRGSFTFLLSVALLAEYRAVLLRPRIRSLHGLRERDVDLLLTELATNGVFREPKHVEGSPDPDDAHICSLATASLTAYSSPAITPSSRRRFRGRQS